MTTYLPPDLLSQDRLVKQSLFQLGAFEINPHAGLSTIFDSNIGLRRTNRENDLITVFSPGFDIFKARAEDQSMSSLRLTYNPAFVFFARHDTNNSLDHLARFNAGLRTAKLTLGLNQEFETSAGGVVDVGSRVDQTYYRTGVRADYDYSEKTSFQISGTHRITDYESLIGSREWTADGAVQYQISAKVALGLGVTVGQLITDEAPRNNPGIIVTGKSRDGNTQTYVTPSLRASYRTTEKTDISVSVGAEYRIFEAAESGWGPVFSLSGRYTPWLGTTFTIEGHRREQNSAVITGQNYVTTGFAVGVQHLFLERWRAHARYSFDSADYQAAARGVRGTRQDDYFLLRYGADLILATSWSVGVFHQYRENSSTSGYSFDGHLVGLQTVWSY